ncbi:CDP-alcohol phosphatidyltransferase family protein [Leptospira levettii]|uniref:CDP-alcohol phosphatidyltransferase family protein n=1 Tax=Leptospira levettii TaxID=2023178 RepID=UPI0010839269|nr:CDP-alcohol phosphatidyltransferase family protein [Leptospira levettii]TGM32986.1 CDP-alcohol phosphatidyltransferase family protein [Leptospira levettii]TGM93718.1 CDP-alcohol phosphatidyltransferase family protein [Leptospira levettii]
MQIEEKKAKDLFQDRIFTLSNFLSIFRVLLLPFFFYSTYDYAKDPSNLSAFFASIGYALVAVITDYLDGLFARLLHQETTLGRYLDPVCDKLVTLGGLSVVTLHFDFPSWVLIVYFIREVLGVWLGGFLYLKRGLQGRPNWWGKFGVGIVAVSVIWYMSLPYFHQFGAPYPFLLHPVISAYVLLFVLTAGVIAYVVRYWNIVLHPEAIELDPENKKQAKKYQKI